MSKHFLQIILIVSFTALSCLGLTSCGGGGGSSQTVDDSSSSGDSQDTPPMNDARTFEISGKINAARSSLVDSDINDITTTPVDNNAVSTAQALFTPVTLGGFSTRPGAGAEGAVSAKGDISDFYKLSIPANGFIELRTADFESADLDIYAYAENCTDSTCFSRDCGREGPAQGSIAQSLQVAETDKLINSGEEPIPIFIEVCAVTGASNYTISVGASTQTSSISTDEAFVPGEFVVEFTTEAESRQSSRSGNRFATFSNLQQIAGDTSRVTLFGFSDDHEMTLKSQAVDKRMTEKRARIARDYPNLLSKWDSIQTIYTLRNNPDIQRAMPNYILHQQINPSDAYYGLQWHFPVINLPDAWDVTTGDRSVVVAVIDGGFVDHPDYRDNLISGYDFVNDPERSYDGDGIDSDPFDRTRGNLRNGDSSTFHGTHVMGTVGASSNDNRNASVAGVAWTTSLMPLRACGSKGCTVYDTLQSVRYAAGLENDSGTVPDKRADVINLSLGGPNSAEAEQILFNEVREAGVIVVASSGNENVNELRYPASYNHVISVSAVDILKKRTSYSNFGAAIDVAAPGGDVETADADGNGAPDVVVSTDADDSEGSIVPTFKFQQGTSMAAPHVAGVIALMKSVKPTLTPQEFDQLLSSGRITDDLGDPGWDEEYGYGLINAFKAVTAVEGEAVNVPVLNVQPRSLNLGESGEGVLQISNGGGGKISDVSVLPVSENNRLSVNPLNTVVGGLGEYEIIADTSNLEEGTFKQDIRVDSSAGQVTVPVYFRAPHNFTPDVGTQYLLLIDLDKGEIFTQLRATVTGDGEYPFRFSGIPEGRYILLVGSDLDNDNFICDKGESCGGYPGLESQDGFQLSSNLNNISILSDFQVELTTNELSSETAGSWSSGLGFSRAQ